MTALFAPPNVQTKQSKEQNTMFELSTLNSPLFVLYLPCFHYCCLSTVVAAMWVNDLPIYLSGYFHYCFFLCTIEQSQLSF